MAQQTIQIADKPTLDNVKALLENSGYGLEALQSLISTSGGVDYEKLLDMIYPVKYDLPYDFYDGYAVMLNNELHILGCGNSSYSTKHYKLKDGRVWVQVSTLPMSLSKSTCVSVVSLNNEIHILSSKNGNIYHYKWNGSSWTSLSTPPFISGGRITAVAIEGALHVFDSSSQTAHHKWNGSSWTTVTTVSTGVIDAVVTGGYIHIFFASASAGYNHYKCGGTSNYYIPVSNTPAPISSCSMCALDDEIHMFYNYNKNYPPKRYVFKNGKWGQCCGIDVPVPYNHSNGTSIATSDDAIHLVGLDGGNNPLYYRNSANMQRMFDNGAEYVSNKFIKYSRMVIRKGM